MKKMTPRERLLAAMAGRPVDRVPCAPRNAARAMQILADDPGGDPVELVLRGARADRYDFEPCFQVYSGAPNILLETGGETHGLDIAIEVAGERQGNCDRVTRTIRTPEGPLREVLLVPRPGCPEYGVSPNPVHLERLVKEPADLARLRCLVADPARYGTGAEGRAMEERVGENGLVLVTVSGPLDYQAGYARAMEDIMVDWYERPEFARELLDIFREKMMAETRVLLERGCLHIFGTWFFASLSVGWSPRIFRELFLPMIREHAALVRSAGGTYTYYDDGRLMGILPMLAETEIDCLETMTPPPVGDADLAAARELIGPRICLKGYIDLLYVLKMGTPEKVEGAVREALEAAGPTGFILGTSDGVRDGTPRENLVAYFRAAHRWRARR